MHKLVISTLSTLAIGAFLVPGPSRPEARAGELHVETTGPAAAPAIRLSVEAQGNSARYRIREQLVGFDLPNDAVGTTDDVTGAIALDSAGRVVPGESRIVVNLQKLSSDQTRRDRFVAERTLLTAQYPTATLAVTGLTGLSTPLPTSGTRQFVLTGDLTIKTVTRPTTWTVNATFAGALVTGTATTSFTFPEFGLDQPRVRSVLSVADTIRLEYQFALRRTPCC
jgi:polyisoprenoid-binding protein YceI